MLLMQHKNFKNNYYNYITLTSARHFTCKDACLLPNCKSTNSGMSSHNIQGIYQLIILTILIHPYVSFTKSIWTTHWNFSLKNVPHTNLYWLASSHISKLTIEFWMSSHFYSIKQYSSNLCSFWCSSKGHRRIGRRKEVSRNLKYRNERDELENSYCKIVDAAEEFITQ